MMREREKEVNMKKFLQKTKERRIQRQRQVGRWGGYQIVRQPETGPGFVMPPAVMDYIPGLPSFFISTLNHTTSQKTDEVPSQDHLKRT